MICRASVAELNVVYVEKVLSGKRTLICVDLNSDVNTKTPGFYATDAEGPRHRS